MTDADTQVSKVLLGQLVEQSEDTAEGLRLLLADLDRGAPREPQQASRVPARRKATRIGRPPRAEALADLAGQAPFPELVTLPADRFGRWLRENVSDPAVLRSAHRFEVEHGRRKSVLREIRARLRSLSEPLGGPDPAPWPGYDNEDVRDIVRQLRQRGSEPMAAHAYAWEHYRRARVEVLEAAGQIAGEQARDLVEQTAPAELVKLPEPWPGYDELSASPRGRDAVRDALDSVDLQDLQKARAYEELTKNRKIMLQAIDTAIRRRRGESDPAGG